MRIDAEFEELEQTFDADFGEVQTASDGGFERGYEEGYARGETKGYAEGHADGLAERTYETWIITFADGSTVERQVALL